MAKVILRKWTLGMKLHTTFYQNCILSGCMEEALTSKLKPSNLERYERYFMTFSLLPIKILLSGTEYKHEELNMHTEELLLCFSLLIRSIPE